MNSKKVLIIILIVFIVLMISASAVYDRLSNQVKPQQLSETTQQGTVTEENQEVSPAPDFAVTDTDGNSVRLSDFRGKPVILNFWASWCGPCKSEMPDFNDAYEAYKDEITFLMVNLTDGAQETIETASSFIAQMSYTFPVYYDTNYEGAYAYGVNSVPVTYFIDEDGYLVTYGQGALDKETLQIGIDMLLN